MKRLIGVLCLTMTMMLTMPHVSEARDYLLGPRDVVAISTWGFEELEAKELVVRDDGKIAFPLVGEIEVSGLSPSELSQKIILGLDGYVNDPKVTVNVIKFRTNRVYVFGEVNRPGLYELERSHRLLDAIGIAGGYTKDAAKSKVFIIHPESVDKPVQADVLKLLKQGDTTQNYVLKDGDTVFLTGNNRIDFARDILPYLSFGLYMKDVNKN